MNKWGIAERLFHLIATVFGKKVLCIHPIFTACLVLKTTRVLCFKNSPYPARWHAPRKSSRSQNLVPYFYFAFPISKEKAVVNSNFPAGRRKGDFLYVWKNGAPPSHLSKVPPRSTCLLQLMLLQIESWGSGACSSNGPPSYNIYSPPVWWPWWLGKAPARESCFSALTRQSQWQLMFTQNLAGVQLPESLKNACSFPFQSARLSTIS